MPSVRAYGDDARIKLARSPDTQLVSMPSVRAYGDDARDAFSRGLQTDVSMPSVRAYGDDARSGQRHPVARNSVSMPSVRAYGDDAITGAEVRHAGGKFQCPRCGRTAMMPLRGGLQWGPETSFNALGAGVRR